MTTSCDQEEYLRALVLTGALFLTEMILIRFASTGEELVLRTCRKSNLPSDI